METISDLKAQLEASVTAACVQECSLNALQMEVTACNQKIFALESALGSDGPHLEVKIPKGDDENSSDSSGDSSGGSSSFVVVGGDVNHGRDRGRPSRDPLLSAQASLVSELQDRHKDATAEVRNLSF